MIIQNIEIKNDNEKCDFIRVRDQLRVLFCFSFFFFFFFFWGGGGVGVGELTSFVRIFSPAHQTLKELAQREVLGDSCIFTVPSFFFSMMTAYQPQRTIFV